MILRIRRELANYLAIVSVMVLLGIAWQAAVQVWDIPPIILPPPWQVAKAAWQERETLCKGLLATGAAATLGLFCSIVVGFAVAMLFSQSKLLRTAFYPYVIFLQTVPIVAIAPLLITWFGYGFKTVVLVSAIISLFPIVSNVTAGLMSVDDNLTDLFRLGRATRLQTLLKLRIPHAVSNLVLGIRVSTGLAVIGAIVGEFFLGTAVAGYTGLGSVMIVWQNRARTDALIAVIIVSTLLGLILLGSMNLITRFCFYRWTSSDHFENER